MSRHSVDRYVADSTAVQTVATARALLTKVICAMRLSPARIASAARLLHVYSRFPAVIDGLEIRVSVRRAEKLFPGDLRSTQVWAMEVDGDRLCVTGGGLLRHPSGSDSFTTFTWEALPGEVAEYCDYSDRVSLVPDIEPFEAAVAAMELDSEAYTIEVYDADNPLLEDEEEDDELKDSSLPDWGAIPITAADRRLVETVDAMEFQRQPPRFAYGAANCDVCKKDLRTCRVFVDGRLHGQGSWGNMCADCFERAGSGIGWGVGQLYIRDDDENWRLAAGFPPVDA